MIKNHEVVRGSHQILDPEEFIDEEKLLHISDKNTKTFSIDDRIVIVNPFRKQDLKQEQKYFEIRE